MAKGKNAEVIKIFGEKVRNAVGRADGFFNNLTGLGTSRDKAQFTRFTRNRRLSHEELDALFSDDDMAARVCEVVPDEELRQGYNVVVDPNENDDVEIGPDIAAQVGVDVKAAATAIGLQGKIIEARTWGRVFGGGIIMIGADDGATKDTMDQPLNLEAIKSVDHLNVLDRRYVHPLKFYSDPMEAKVGLPMTYLVTPQAATDVDSAFSMDGTFEVHESRMVIFGGVRTTIRTKQSHSGWDQSLLQRMQTIITQFGSSWDSLAHVLQDAAQGVYTMEGYIDALASDDTATIMKRLDMLDMSRSAVRAVVLDAGDGDSPGEKFERLQYNWSGIDQPYTLLMLRLASAARMPVTVLMGQSPAGMNATGESDIQWFYDVIASTQENVIQPAIEYILRLIMLSQSGPTSGAEPDSWTVTFPSLWQPTPVELAAIELSHAQADQIYHTIGAASTDEIAVSRFSEGGFEKTLTVNLEERRANLAAASIEGDIEDTPTATGIVDLSTDIAAARSMTAMQELATAVQNGTLTPESAASALLASTVGLSMEEALDIVGEPDPVKVTQLAAMAAGLDAAADGDGDGGDGGSDGTTDEPPADDPAVQETADALHDPEADAKRKKKKRKGEGEGSDHDEDEDETDGD